MRKSGHGFRRIGVAACSTALALGASAQGAIRQWSATGTSTAWATPGNWVGNVAPVNDLVTDIALFDSTSYAFQPNAGTTSINGIQVGDGVTATAALTISGTNLGIGASGLNILAGSGAVTLAPTTLSLGASQSFTDNSSAALNITSGGTNSGTSPVTLTLNGTGSGGTTYSGNITNGSGAATTALLISEAGQVVLAGNNSFTGGATIVAGSTVVVSGTTAFGGGPLTLNGPGIVKLRSTNGAAKTVANAVNWGSDVEFYSAGGSDKGLTFSNGITLSGTNRTIILDSLGAAAIETLGGAIASSGNTNLTIVNNGTVAGESIAFTGGINNTGTITNSGIGTDFTTISSPIGANVTGVIQNSATSTLVLSGNNSTFAGAITVQAGTLQLGDGTNGALPSSQAITAAGGSFNYLGVTTGSTQNLGVLTFNGDGTVQSTYGTSGNTLLSFSALTPRANGVTGNFVTSGGANGTAASGGTNAITLGGVSTGVMGPGFFFDGGTANANYAFYDAGGFVRGISYGSDANSATTGGSTTGLPAGSFLQMTGAVTGQNTATLSTLNISGANSLTLNAGQALTLSGILKSGASAATISGGAGLQAPSGGELIIRSDQSADALTISMPILADGASSLTKAGPGVLTLSGVNTYTGGTTIDNGTLAINAEGAAGAGGSLGLTPSVATPGNVVLNGGTLKATAVLTLNANRGITLGSNGGSVVAGLSGNNFEIDGLIAGSGTLTVAAGAGNYVPRGASTYSGGTTLATGAIVIPVSDSSGPDGAPTSGPFGTGTINFAGAQMRPTTSTDINIQNPLTFSADTTFLSGALTSLTFTGPVTLATGTRTLTNSGAAPGFVGFSGVIGDGGSNYALKTAGAGTIVFSGANTYTGGTTITTGTFVANNTSGSVTGTGAVSIISGTLASGAVGTISGVVTSSTAANTIAPGGTNAFGTLNIGGLIATSFTTVNLDESAPWSGTPANTGDLLNITGGIFSTPGGGLKIILGDSPSAPGDYRLIGYSGASGLNSSNIPLPTAPARTSYSLDFGSANVDPGYVDLIVTNTGPGPMTSNWTGTTATASWATSSNPPWDTGVYPSISGDTAILGSSIGTTNAVITLDGQQHVGTLTFNNATPTPGTYTLSTGTGGLLVLDNGASTATLTNATTAADVISAPIYVQSNSSISVSMGTLSITGGITGGGNLTLNNNTSAAALTISSGVVNPSGTITNAGTGTGTTAISSAIGLNVAGIIENSATSALSLSGANVFTSGVFISAGTLNASSANALGVPFAPITLGAASGTLSASLLGSSATFGNPITLATGDSGALTIGNTTTSTPVFSGTISGSNNLVLASASSGSVTLSGAVNLSGSITNSGAGSGTNTISGVVAASATGVTQNSSTSALTLSGTNLYTAPTTITAGTLNATNLAIGGVPSSLGASSSAASNVIINGGTLNYTGSTAATTDRQFTIGNASGSESGGIGASGTTSAATVTYSYTGPVSFGDTNAHTLTLTGTNTGANVFNPSIADNSGATSFAKTGAGAWVLPAGNNTYTGTTSITGGTLQVNASTNGLGNAASSISLAAATLNLLNDGAGSNGTIIYGSAANATGYNITIPQSTVTINVDHLTSNNTANTIQLGNLAATTTASGASALNVTGGDGYSLTFNGTSTFAYVMTLNPTTANLVLNGNISTPHTINVTGIGNTTLNGTVGITNGSVIKTGAGTLALANAASTYTLPTEIDGGTLNAASLANGASASAIGKPGSGGAPASLLFGGGTLQYSGTAAVTTDRLFTLGDANGNSATLDASGSAAAATVTFSSTSAIAYPATNVTSPVLTFTGTNAGTNTGTNTFAPAIADESGTNLTSVSKTGSGTWTITGGNTYSGGTTIAAGTFLANTTGTSATGMGNVSVVMGGTLGGNGNIALGAANSVSIAGPATLAPGLPSSTGSTLTVAGGTGVSLLAGSTFAVKTAASGTNDSLALTGSGVLTIAGGDTLALTSTSAGTFNIATWASGATESGAFSTVLLNNVNQGSPGISSPFANESLYTYATGTTVLYDNADQFIQVGVASVPEPASLSLLAFAGLGLLRRRRRKI